MRTIDELAADLAQVRMAIENLNMTNMFGADKQQIAEIERRRIELDIKQRRLDLERSIIIEETAKITA